MFLGRKFGTVRRSSVRPEDRTQSPRVSKSQKLLLIAVAVLLATGLLAAVLWLGRSEPAIKPPDVAMPTKALDTEAPSAGPADPRMVLSAPQEYSSLPTTVAFPLSVTLELVHADDAPHAQGAAALGSGATAHFAGSILDATGEGLRAEVAFVAGVNQGRVLYCDRVGKFGANDLYPGISIVSVKSPGTPGSMREVRLRQERDTLLNIGYGRLAHVFGQVFDAQSKPMLAAKVTMDGQERTTDETGMFEFQGVASGEVLVLVERPGYASYRELLNVASGSRVEPGHLKYLLERAARLQVTIADAVNSGEKAQLFVLPTSGNEQRKFPWHSVNPIAVFPGGTVTIEDLPPGGATLRLFHAGAIAKPPLTSVTLVAGETVNATLHLEPAPVVSGIVTEAGAPAVGATVRMEVPDRTQAMLSVFGQSNYMYLESEVFPSMPPAVQEASTNARGEYSLSADETVSRVRYVTATSQDGKKTASRILKGGENRVDLALEPRKGGEGEIVIQMDKRFQPLPVQMTVNGEPKDPYLLPPGKDLHIENLSLGSWLLSVDWNGTNLISRQPVQVQLKHPPTLEANLPDGAIQGQDADTLKRAGRGPK
jgi:hypothetical protein